MGDTTDRLVEVYNVHTLTVYFSTNVKTYTIDLPLFDSTYETNNSSVRTYDFTEKEKWVGIGL